MKRFFLRCPVLHAAQAFAAEPAMPSGAYASAQFGNGRIYGGNAGSDRGMAGRALELRFGHHCCQVCLAARRMSTPTTSCVSTSSITTKAIPTTITATVLPAVDTNVGTVGRHRPVFRREQARPRSRAHARTDQPAAEYALRDRTHLFVTFSRVKTFHERNDRDLFHVGVLRSFGR
jgi:hypothetical protein